MKSRPEPTVAAVRAGTDERCRHEGGRPDRPLGLHLVARAVRRLDELVVVEGATSKCDSLSAEDRAFSHPFDEVPLLPCVICASTAAEATEEEEEEATEGADVASEDIAAVKENAALLLFGGASFDRVVSSFLTEETPRSARSASSPASPPMGLVGAVTMGPIPGDVGGVVAFE